ncbi:low affinity sulfate transporter 3-like [Coffea eugenioides]|uniref:low affinity sulfate transporter 3-like n=1 Tax=Coffea eugenioides TaxID=49369 RepID=UPI000F615A8F|nr:low affinity sulfate transporter 3-like [Coffea eugenioides]
MPSTSLNERGNFQFSEAHENIAAEAVARAAEDLSQFPQTLQTTTVPSAQETSIMVADDKLPERFQWVLNAPEPPGLWCKLQNGITETIFPLKNKFQHLREHQVSKSLGNLFPILSWGKAYNIKMFRKDLLAGLTLASLCIPQSIGYATLAKLDPQYGLYTSVVPPFLYAILGTSREIAIGPVAVVSLLLSAMIQKIEDPVANPVAYTGLVITVTLFAGIFQAAFGAFRLGFLVDLLSHAAIVGFMAGAAIMIGLQQLKGLLGTTKFTNKTDIISVLAAVWRSVHDSWNPLNFILGCSFLSFILTTRFLGRKKQKLFWLSTIAPLTSVVLSTLIVFLTRADKHGVKIVKHIKSGLNPISVHQLQLNGPHTAEAAKIGLIVAVVALAEAIAVGRSFASVRGYHLDGNKEMVAMGVMNVAGSLTSCYVATGSFSRTAVNFSAGCETVVSNIVMAVTVIISLELFTRLLFYTPIAILASIILSALPGLIDLNEAYNIWKVDKLDFLACIGAFLGVLFASVEIGLLVAVGVSFVTVILSSIQPGTETLGRIPGTDIFVDVNQYPMAVEIPGILVTRLKCALLCFANSNCIKERILQLATGKQEVGDKGNAKGKTQLIVFDMSNLMNIDTTGLASLKELHNSLASEGIEFAVTNPRWQVIHKLRLANFVNSIGRRVFLTVGEAIDACITAKMA